MSRTAQAPAQEIRTAPQWETRAKRPLANGMWPGTDNSMWLWRMVPMASVTDAKSAQDALNAGAPLHKAYEELAALIPRGGHRRQLKQRYRQTHALLVSVPTWFTANPGSPIEGYLNRQYGQVETIRRVLMFGVKLSPSIGNGGFRAALDSFVETVQYGGAPLADFDRDYTEVDSMLSRCGFQTPTSDDMRFVDSWWNHGRSAGVPVLTHEEHVHFFQSVGTARRLSATNPTDCSVWPVTSDEHAITFASVEDFDLRYTEATDPLARWVTPMLDVGARVVSVRALVEPARVTRNELRSQSSRYRDDMREAAAQNKMERSELKEREEELKDVERAYASGNAAATLVDVSVIVGFDGVIEDISMLAPNGLILSPMLNRQAAAWHETMVCSSVRANPNLHDLPATTIAYSALPSISRVGDADGALLGFTERDRQPTYVSPTAASAEDSSPAMFVLAGTGAGKTLCLLNLAVQFHKMGRPQLIVDPKTGSDHSNVVLNAGGRVASLDDFVTGDGALDPMRFAPSKAVGVQLAASMISQVNPIGPEIARYETEIANAIRYGADQGAVATGEALMLAMEAGIIREEVARPIFQFAEVYPMFRATFGMHPGTPPLSVNDGLTLIKVGKASFDRPPQGYVGNIRDLDPVVRTSMNAIRMIVRGGMMALTGRGGVMHIDESWMVEKTTPDELDALGRLARSQNVLPIFYTQRPSGPLGLGLKGYASRGAIGHIRDEEEGTAAATLFNLQSNTDMLRRLPLDRYLADGHGLNWDSLRALPNPAQEGVVRGTVFYHVDLRGRVAPVEVLLNPEFLRMASTTPDDVARNARERAGVSV